MIYNHYMYLWPPRPEEAVSRDLIPMYERRHWIAQKKKNGTNTPIFTNGQQVIFKTRHNEDHKLWSAKQRHIEFFRQQPNNKWNVYCGELLHHKTPHIKDQLYLFDIIVCDGIHLIGMPFADRYNILLNKWKVVDEHSDTLVVSSCVSIAKCFSRSLLDIYDHQLNKEDEGLVLKNPKAGLSSCLQNKKNGGWQVKCRIIHKNYGF